MSVFRWTEPRINAARLVAEGTLTNEQIAAACGVTFQTLHNWKKRPEFQAKVQEHLDALTTEIKNAGIADRQNRVDALNDRHRRMLRVIEERAVAHDGEAPGSGTGLLVKQIRSVGIGKENQVVEEWVVDTGLLHELRAHEKQAAQELGQWSERSKVDVDLDGEIEKLAREFGRPVDEVRAELSAMLKGGD